MQLHIDEISSQIAPGAHAILILDQAGWHIAAALVVPDNITIILLPPRSPELNPAENVWQYMRQNWFSNRVFKTYDEIIVLCCHAWNKLIDRPWLIMSIGFRNWAVAGHPQ
jgi:transposase